MSDSAYWTVAAFSLLATWLNVRKEPLCFALWVFTNMVWMVADFRHGLPAQGTLHAAYLLLAVWGLLRWRIEPPRRPPPPPTPSPSPAQRPTPPSQEVLHGTAAA
ncbi:MAG: nicotinamide mononucleotide transporter [Myxococcales bacterium]|nr:nicotinamide mononucleotide transporter [Myxococcales bacterium]